ncbi:hypothetical protein EJ05DRAFT_494065 [Pseudovirgaria hyperparasitica]|uniref:EF-hand n=1 Tax=Pseudovirgaria hyperparasitica TaxID=470096 RepID=A0A6A6W0R7_9PEZI|nr:uncharacterized protein EJ05DRAFT_494065 [Pseudovirgaria hyperparasitica]KAF2755686.1 hypothetical protein EJ05DRAFT_494065 [Pseudovirgaria hyperparasitica]
MAESAPSTDINHSILNLSADEKRYFKQLFNDADTENIGVVTGEVAVKFFERTKVPSPVLGIIWQIADTDNRGLLTSAGFCIVLRLIGHYQAGREPTQDLAFKSAPLPKFDGMAPPPATVLPPPPPMPIASIQPQMSGPIRVPPLAPEKATEYAALFEKFGTNGILAGDTAKQIFEKAGLSNEVLSRIWNLADTEQRGALSVTEFIIAMHLLASMKSGQMKGIPNNLPAGLYEAASRRAIQPVPPRLPTGSLGPSAIPRQFSGQSAQRTQSPLGRAPYGTPPQSNQATGNDWIITPQEKAPYDSQFSKLDREGNGYITGEQAVNYFTDSALPEDTLAAIWDLADINSVGQLSRDEFAVAMHLIRQQRKPGTPLPTTLPANLIPPSMRNQTRPPARPTAPAFETAYSGPQATKSAAEDLFGLDSFSSAAPAPHQIQQSTGGSGTFNRPFEADPFGSKTSSPTSPNFQNRSQRDFKPFMPTSSFGQSLQSRPTVQQTNSPLSQSRELPQQASAMEDLLGDNDPEVSKKLTSETAELANMSNQIGTLRTQMQEVQNKKGSTEKELAGAGTQKRDLELRLSQFRSQYEIEVKNVKTLEERLTASRNETRKLQSDLALIEGTYQDLQNDFRQKSAAYEADQQENASLKERIRQINNEVASLRPQVEKLKNDARQQKGLVAINKKQLSTSEQERDKLTTEASELTKMTATSRSPYATPAESNVVSPAASTVSQSTNPFFRKSPAPPTENTMSPSGFARSDSLANTRDFDNIFGTSSSASHAAAPQTSFKAETQPGSSVRSSEPDVPTPSTSPPLSSYHESPRNTDPPPPPESRQFNANLLPLRESVPRSDSFSSSVKVSAPASRYDDAAGADTPTASNTPAAARRPETSRAESSSYGTALFNRNQTASPAVSSASDNNRDKDNFQNFGQPSATRDIPGAFPRDVNSPIQPELTGESSQSKGSTNRNDPFATKEQARGPGSSKMDFDSAFADFKTGRQVQEHGAQNKFNKEFPPIEEFGHDEESDSNTSPRGAQASSSRPTTRPPPPRSEADLPTPNAQQSPPTYESSVPQRSGSNQFPPEFSGLLPSRGDPTSQSGTSGGQGHNLFGGAPSSSKPSAPNTTFSVSPPPNDTPTSTVPSDAYHSAVSHPNSGSEPAPTQVGKTSFGDDFDNGFDDLSEAKEADDKTEDDFVLSSHHRDDEFNPVFDSPAASKSNTMASQQTPTGKTGFGDDSDFDTMSQSFGLGKSSQAMNSSHDWDAIFSGLESSKDQSALGESSGSGFASFDAPPPNEGTKLSQPPQLSRALSATSEHDDPLVKQFTSMGFPRSKVVPALEQFDYDSQKTGEFLASEAK